MFTDGYNGFGVASCPLQFMYFIQEKTKITPELQNSREVTVSLKIQNALEGKKKRDVKDSTCKTFMVDSLWLTRKHNIQLLCDKSKRP